MYIAQNMDGKLSRCKTLHGEEPQSKRKRTLVFVDWLLDTFGLDFLRNGSGVLDVAGGRGNLAFELFTMRGIPCTTIDPREQKFTRKQLQALQRDPKARARGAPRYVKRLFDPDLWQEVEFSDLLTSCSICVGMHPDEATEPIVDFALQFKKPFAVVPCCVFPTAFPDRKLLGQHVVTHAQFVEFLVQKSGGATTHLPFQGLNTVVYKNS